MRLVLSDESPHPPLRERGERDSRGVANCRLRSQHPEAAGLVLSDEMRPYNAFMSSAVDIGSLITRDPSIRGGRPFVAGTGVTVQRIATWYKLGLTSEEIADRIGHLTLAQIHAAIAYYHANRDEIEQAIAADDERAAELEAEGLPRQQ